jgi:DNA polymerase III epsilon subunit-like protein
MDGYELKPGVVNAPSAAAAAAASASASVPPHTVRATDEQLDGLDVHFLPHFLLLFISRDPPTSTDVDGSKTTRAFRIQHSVAQQIQSALATLKAAQKSHYASSALLTQTILATQLNLANMQQQMMVLTQQSFLVQSKLSFVLAQQQGLLNSVHQLTQQAHQATNANVAAMIARQIQGLQGSLQAVAGQSAQLQAQKLAIAQKMAAVQSATANVTTGGVNAGGMGGLQGKVQMLQAQLAQLEQSYDLRLDEGESSLRALIVSHLSSARGGGAFDPATLSSASIDDLAVYELAGVVAHIADPPEKDSPLHTINGEHLVAHIKVERDVYDRIGADDPTTTTTTRLAKQLTPTASPDRFACPSSSVSSRHLTSPHSPTTSSLAVSAEEHDGNWAIFNDFVIRPSNGFEATRFTYQWKQPCAVLYKLMNPQETTNIEATVKVQGPGPGALAPTALTRPRTPTQSNPFMHEHMIYSYAPSLALRYHESMRSFQPLVAGGPQREQMDSSTLVAIDCEFVSVQSELLDIDDATGSSVVVRPSRLTLARVSVVRGSGPMAGVPFIDDYIATSEPVVDYLTKYSGIAPGDLDRAVSTHHLTSLKHAYVKLRAMVERGVRFIGHGLKKDLQMLNIIIPPRQVFDTVELFSLPNQRKLGLRFLALHVLQLNIQQDTHDSIEDARTALQLYHQYMELKQKGTLQQCLMQLYETGHRSGFKV